MKNGSIVRRRGWGFLESLWGVGFLNFFDLNWCRLASFFLWWNSFLNGTRWGHLWKALIMQPRSRSSLLSVEFLAGANP